MTMSKGAEDFDLSENSRLWQPSRAKPYMEKEACNRSFVPLGTLNSALMKKKAAAAKRSGGDSTGGVKTAPALSEFPLPPPSPAVSGLCSLALTPRSLPTPLIAGIDLPLACAPPSSSSSAGVGMMGARQKQPTLVSFEGIAE